MEMDPDVLLTIAFVLYAVVVAAGTGLLIARSRRNTILDQAVEIPPNRRIPTAHPVAECVPAVSARHRHAPRR